MNDPIYRRSTYHEVKFASDHDQYWADRTKSEFDQI